MPDEAERPAGEVYVRRLLDLAPDLFCVFEPQGVLRYVSSPVAVLGFTAHELLGANLLALVHPDDARTTQWQLERATALGPPVRFENRCRGKDGEHRWLAWLVSRAADQTYAAVIRDASERKWVERELEASLSLVEATLESTADGILVADRAGNVVTFNRRFLEMWGVADAVVFSGAAEIDRVCDAMLASLEGHISLTAELEEVAEAERYEVLTLKDGRIFERYSLPRRIRGELEGRVWSFRDVTERVRAERELRDHLSMGIEHAVEGIARLDANGRYTAVNPVFAKMLGYEESELVGTEWAARCHPDDRAAVLSARTASAPDGKNEVEARAVRKDGSIAVMRVLVVPADAPGASGHHVFMRDISEQREMQERLLLADRMASMGTLAAGVAHEINNPLTFVRDHQREPARGAPPRARGEPGRQAGRRRLGAPS
jgi:PAS domain S-box-containing protein